MRLMLLLIGVVIILAILWDGKRRKQKQTQALKEAQFFGDNAQDDVLAPDEAPCEAAVDQAALIEEAPENLEASQAYDEAQVAVETHAHEALDDSTQNAVSETPLKTTHAAVDAHATVRAETPPELVWFTLVAPEEKPFGGFSLLQVLLANGFRFAEDQLFYYHENREAGGVKLFALAAATESGTFDLSNMARFSCKGLILFLHPKEQQNVMLAFNEMLEAAENLAKALEATLYIEESEPWTQEHLTKLGEKLKSCS